MVDHHQTLDGARRNAYDPDEIEEEQRERERRNAVAKSYAKFCKTVEAHWQREHPSLELEWQRPFPNLAFHGVPFKVR